MTKPLTFGIPFAIVAFIFLMASCVSTEKNPTTVTAFPATLTPPPVTLTPTETPYPTPPPTSTLPPPLPTPPLIPPPAGLLFTSFHTPEYRVLYLVLPDSQISQIAAANEREAALSNRQRFVAFFKYVPADAQASSYLAQFWIRDRQKKIEKQIEPPANCSVQTDSLNWSPDDSRLYYLVGCKYDRDLWYVNMETWETVNVTAKANRVEHCFYFLGDAKCSFAANSPERMIIASAPMETPQSVDQIYIPRWESSRRLTEVDTHTGEYRVLDENTELFETPSISPDGAVIAYDRGHLLHKDGTIEQLPLPDLGFPPIYKEGADLVNPSWSPDGKTIAWDAMHIDGWNQSALVFYDFNSRKFREVFRFEPYYWNISICICEIWYTRPHAWSPNGAYFAYVTPEFHDYPTSDNSNMFFEEHVTLRVFDKRGAVKFSMKGVSNWKLAWSPDGKWLAFGASERNIFALKIYVLNTEDWKVRKVDLPFENVLLEGCR